MLKQWLLVLLRGWLVMIPSECRSVLETEGSSSTQSPCRILPQKEFRILFIITVHWMNTQDKSRSSPGYLRRGDKGAICEQKHQDEREEMEGPERKRRSDHLGHSCSRLGKGHRSDQQMQTVSPRLSGFSALLTRQVLRRQLRDAPQTHLLSLVFVFSRAAIAKYHKWEA